MTTVVITLLLDERQRPVPHGIGNIAETPEEAGIMNRAAGESVVSVLVSES